MQIQAENGELETNESHETEQETELEGSNGETPDETEGDGSEAEGDEDVIGFGDAESPTASEKKQEPAPQWVKDLRKRNRELERQLRDKQTQPEVAISTTAETAGPEPTLEGSGWDDAQFKKDYAAYLKKQADIDARKKQADDAHKAQQEAHVERIKSYKDAAAKLKVPDFEEAEDAVVDILSEAQQGLLLAGADNPHTLVYALGKNPEKAKELAKITDPVKFAFAASKLEKDIKVTTRKGSAKPAPEGMPVKSTASFGHGSNALDRLRAEAEKTGDYSKVVQYKKQMKAAGK